MKKIFLSLCLLATINCYCQQKAFKVNVYGKGHAIILIPGYACSGEVWNETVKDLKGHYQLHVLTLAGFAGVPAIDSPVLQTAKDALIQYVKENHLDKPVLIGHSLGAFMCLWVASEEPLLFSKIICVDGVPFLPAITNSTITVNTVKNNPAYSRKTVASRFANIQGNTFSEDQFKLMKTMVSDTAHARLITKWTIQSDPKTLTNAYVEMSNTDLREQIAKIKIPVLVLASTYGNSATSQKIFSDQYSNLTNKVIIVAPTKHFIMYDNPFWFRGQVENFLINDLRN
jgi:N-formylmaleamate deformylase